MHKFKDVLRLTESITFTPIFLVAIRLPSTMVCDASVILQMMYATIVSAPIALGGQLLLPQSGKAVRIHQIQLEQVSYKLSLRHT